MSIAVCVALLIILGGGAGVAVWMYWREKDRADALEDKYSGITNLDRHKEQLRAEIEKSKQTIGQLEAREHGAKAEVAQVERTLALYQQDMDVVEHGLYRPMFDFDKSEHYKREMLAVYEEQKALIRDDQACSCSTTWTVNGSATEGRKQTKHYAKLMLRAFNGEAEAMVADVRWNNVERMLQRLESAYEAINKLGSTHAMSISRSYFDLKLKEIRLAYEYQEKLKREKDEQRRAQEELHDEQKAQREAERAVKEAHDEELRYQRALSRARSEMESAKGAEVGALSQKVAELERQLAEATQAKERAKAMAELTKCGHVYVISNIGSFGEGVFKIGMTRRLEPMDRVHELGDASVPFAFDVHAMIYTENAPDLEAKLHARFEARRVNMVNDRKEFFRVSIDEIAAAVKEHKAGIEVVPVPEAREFRETLARLKAAATGQPAQSEIKLNTKRRTTHAIAT